MLATVARLCPSKGIEDSIDAMAVIHQRHPGARLLIVGEALQSTGGQLSVDGHYRGRLEERARALGLADRILFLGYRADVPAILREASVVLQPSLTEGLSNSILEAMAAGRSVVATPVGGTPELIEDGVTGVLTPVSHPHALGEAVSALIEEPGRREALGARARAFVHGRFSVQAMVDQTEQVYRQLLARKRPRTLGRAPQSVPVP
jgi:glycosyltransferase involved in cell wall biosynthesis